MSDESVRAALRSDAAMVVVEAPAGCGKTHQGANYAKEIAAVDNAVRPLILAHTHAACSVFTERTQETKARVEIKTIDSLIGQIASAYHLGLDLPADVGAWVRQREEGYVELALKVATLLRRQPMIASSVAERHRVVICDEHQDSSGDQHAVVMAIHEQGAKVRMFADPMQKIFGDKGLKGSSPPCDWNDLRKGAQAVEELDFPHRWTKGCPKLGEWVLMARKTLKDGGRVNLKSGLPDAVDVVFAENQAQQHQQYQLTKHDRKRIDAFERDQSSLLILTHHNKTARSFCGFFNRSIPLWEGHTRSALEKLANAIGAAEGNREALASSVITFMGDIGKGFSPSAFGNLFQQEVREGCAKNRTGKSRTIQDLARHLVADPSHRGIAKVLHHLSELKGVDPAFADIEMDHHKEFWDAIRLGDFEAVDAGLAEISHRRTYSRPKPPDRAISTIHKAKGLECDSVIVMPCDAKTFQDKIEARHLLYVAISRARTRLMLVVSRTNPSPLFVI